MRDNGHMTSYRVQFVGGPSHNMWHKTDVAPKVGEIVDGPPPEGWEPGGEALKYYLCETVFRELAMFVYRPGEPEAWTPKPELEGGEQ